MSIDQTLEFVVLGLAFAVVAVYAAFSIHFAFAAPWWRTSAGRALMVSSPAVAVLLGTELFFEFVPASERVQLVAIVATLSLILAGGMLKYGSFLYERSRGKPRRRRISRIHAALTGRQR